MGSHNHSVYRCLMLKHPMNGREEFRTEGQFKPSDEIGYTFEARPGPLVTLEERCFVFDRAVSTCRRFSA